MTLGGSLFVADGIKYDYCFCEALESLGAVCDQVAVTFFNEEDFELFKSRRLSGSFMARLRPYSEWENSGNQLRLSYWTNETKKMLSTDWHFNLQGDEVIHEDCFPLIREAVNKGQEGFRIRRYNLWRDPWHYLDVPQERKPVSDYVCRLGKLQYESSGDGESVSIPNASDEYSESIAIYHMGFVRDPKRHVDKINNMGKNIFGWGEEPKLKGKEVFDPYLFFNDADLKPIPGTLPKFVEQWVSERYPRAS